MLATYLKHIDFIRKMNVPLFLVTSKQRNIKTNFCHKDLNLSQKQVRKFIEEGESQ